MTSNKMENLVEIQSEEHLQTFIGENQKRLVVLYFWAPWSGPANQVHEVIATLAPEYPDVFFGKIEAEKLVDLCKSYGVKAVPNCQFLYNRKTINKLEGIKVKELVNLVKTYSLKISSASLSATNFIEKVSAIDRDETSTSNSTTKFQEDNIEGVDDYIRELINGSKIIAFIKGTKEVPQCKFTKELVSIFGSLNAEYDTFDILQNEQVRQRLKVYSDWPTYPQVYVKGELIGGLDIIKEMCNTGEFQELMDSLA